MGWHPPPEQTELGPHVLPHVPQLLGSVSVSTHTPEQTCAPCAAPPIAGHTQLLNRHSCAAGQVVPHPPQLFLSKRVSTQSPPHRAMFAPVHVAEHAPLSQTEPVPHFEPHVPQLLRSVCVSTHDPPHAVSRKAHVAAASGPESTPLEPLDELPEDDAPDDELPEEPEEEDPEEDPPDGEVPEDPDEASAAFPMDASVVAPGDPSSPFVTSSGVPLEAPLEPLPELLPKDPPELVPEVASEPVPASPEGLTVLDPPHATKDAQANALTIQRPEQTMAEPSPLAKNAESSG